MTAIQDPGAIGDGMTAVMDRERPIEDDAAFWGLIVAEWSHEDGTVFHRSVQKNLITAVGDQMYAARGAGIGSPPNAPIGMKLGTGSTAVAKTGAGAALVTYLSGSNKTFDATYPQASGGVATYKRTYAAGEGTTASNITEVVIFNDTNADATSTAANTISRALLASPAAKAAGDTLTITWTHTLLGA